MLSPLMDAILVIAIVVAVGALVVLGVQELRSLARRKGPPGNAPDE
jgi:hypothetical protein